MKRILALILTPVLALILAGAANAEKENTDPMVRLTTNQGVIELQLDAEKAPKTVANFVEYVKKGHYDGLIFHRVIPGFMIQGGGFEPGMKERSTGAPIDNEADNGLKNLEGTIAMARTNDPNSATAQFFINTVDNAFLNHRSKDMMGWGYAVFGKVTSGMDVVKKIEKVSTGSFGPYQDVPTEPVIIEKAEMIEK